jgi:hypothetical protein
MNQLDRGTRVFTRAGAILVLIGAFVATEGITVGKVDALAIVAVLVAGATLAIAVIVAVRQPADERTFLLAGAEAGVLAAGALAIFGIFRTVLPSTSASSDPILGAGLAILLVILWLATDGGGFARARRVVVRTPVAGAPAVPPADGGAVTTAAVEVEAPATPRLNILQVIVAVAVVLTYGAMLYGLWQGAFANLEDKPWSRLVELKSGVEQVAFGALGALLGYAVQSRATSAATDEAEKAKKEKEQAVDVAKGLSAVAGGDGSGAGGQVEGLGADTGDAVADRAVQLAVLRERLRALEAS